MCYKGCLKSALIDLNKRQNRIINEFEIQRRTSMQDKINLCIRKKPKYIPLKIWHLLLSKILYMKHFK